MKKIIIIAVLLLVGGLVYTQRVIIKDAFLEMSKESVPPAQPFESFKKEPVEQEPVALPKAPDKPVVIEKPDPVIEESIIEEPIVNPEPEPVAKPLPTAVNLAVPFQPQAPHAIWDLPYKEACEEAAFIMVDYYFKNLSMTPEQMDNEILKLVAWEAENGYDIDVSMLELGEIIEALYEYETRLISVKSVDDIRSELAQGYPVIIPLAGREIGNPFYTYPGPLYHVMVIKGMTADGQFITNDPGTKRGADYVYSPSTLISAMGDWDGDSPDGPPRALVVIK